METPQAGRQRFALRRFSLRALLLFVTAACIWCAVIGNRARQQRIAVEAVRAAGGIVAYDFHWEQNVRSLEEGEPPGPQWLRALLGIDFLADVVLVQVSQPTANVIEQLPNLPALERLGLIEWEPTDADLEILCTLTQLKKLFIATAIRHLSADDQEKLRASLPETEVEVID